MYTDVLRVLHSWVRRSLRSAKVRCFPPALLYGLLYKQALSVSSGCNPRT
jgi:hypothetical protein